MINPFIYVFKFGKYIENYSFIFLIAGQYYAIKLGSWLGDNFAFEPKHSNKAIFAAFVLMSILLYLILSAWTQIK